MKENNRKTTITENQKQAARYWKDGIMGVITGDALGCPVQFRSREAIARNPVTTMIGHGTYNMPVGTWTDDGSMTLATLAGIRQRGGLNPADIMYRFALWLTKGEYTPFGEAFDNGRGTTDAIIRYLKNPDPDTCGGCTEYDNGNGSLMRIMPACLYCFEQQKAGAMTDAEAVSAIHRVSGLTHNHIRAKIACGLYYFMTKAILENAEAAETAGNEGNAGSAEDAEIAGTARTVKNPDGGTLLHTLRKGLDEGFAFYRKQDPDTADELTRYRRLADLETFRTLPSREIRSTGYVVDTLEAAVWSLLQTGSFRDALLTAVNLGDDTDTVGAVCGGLAGLFYGYEAIPADWLDVIQRRRWIEGLCENRPDENGGRNGGKYMSRQERKARNAEIFKDTSAKCKNIERLWNSILESTWQRKLILEEDILPEVRKDRYEEPANIIVSGKRSFEAARQYTGQKTCVLNFASAVNPGGGVKNGSSAQEEALCRCSTLYFTLDTPKMMTKFYLPHRQADNPLYNDDIIYTPEIIVFKSDTDEPEMLPRKEWFETDVLTCAAPNLRDIDIYDPYCGHEAVAGGIGMAQLRAVIEKRVRRIFEVAALEGVEVLVLGAFGCGAFRNPPELAADVFRQVTAEYRHAFRTIEYAIYCADHETVNYKAFAQAFRDMMGGKREDV